MICAGEASGDRLGAGLARSLRAKDPSIQLFGMGGPAMREAGVEIIQEADEISVVGIAEVLARLPQIRAAMSKLEAAVRERKPDVLVPIDFPDFNLRLAAKAKAAGVSVVYFVSPQIWAWREGRVKTIRERIDEMLVLFEFETDVYTRAGIPVTWVGHPFAEPAPTTATAEQWRERLGLSADGQVIALLPGSRRGEVQKMLPPLLGAAARLHQQDAQRQFVIPVARSAPRDWIAEQVTASATPDLILADSGFPEWLSCCDAGIVTSGTASLECAVRGLLPCVVIYKIHPLTHWIGKRLIRVDHIALPNLIAERRVLPELVQHDCTPEKIAAETERFLTDTAVAAETREALVEIHRRLGPPGIYERAAERVFDRLQSR